MFTATNFTLIFGKGAKKIESAIPEYSFDVPPGSLIGITGNSGSGKTLLLSSFGGFLPYVVSGACTNGELRLGDTLITQGNINPNIAFVTENPFNQNTGLKSTFVGELVFPVEARGYRRRMITTAANFVATCLRLNKIIDSELTWLSGGESQHLHLGAALIFRPSLLLLDQALTELDWVARLRFLSILRAYVEARRAVAVLSYSPGELASSTFDALLELPSRPPVPKKVVSLPSSLRCRGDDLLEEILWVKDLSFEFEATGMTLFGGLTFRLGRGEMVFLLGPNGSGKSTFGKLLLGLMPMQRGSVRVKGRSIENRIENDGSLINCVFQNPDLYFCRSTVRQELADARSESHKNGWLSVLIESLTLEQVLDVNPFDLSRGQRKRLAFAVAASACPEILFLDEPSQYQDETEVESVAAVMELCRGCGIAIICCTHDDRLLNRFAETQRITLAQPVLCDGREKRSDKGAARILTGGDLWLPPPSFLPAKQWVTLGWERISGTWIEHIPELHVYWQNCVYPGLRIALTEMALTQCRRYLDVGCGVGWQTGIVSALLQQAGAPLDRILGVDAHRPFVGYAKWFYHDREPFQFCAADATNVDQMSSACTQSLKGSADLVSAFFVLHDEPDVAAVLKNIYNCASDGAFVICTIVNPERAERLKHAGAMRAVDSDETEIPAYGDRPAWLWTAMYPVVRASEDPFYMPYFHRALVDYLILFEQCGFERVQTIPLWVGESYPYNLAAARRQILGVEDEQSKMGDLGLASAILIVARKPAGNATRRR